MQQRVSLVLMVLILLFLECGLRLYVVKFHYSEVSDSLNPTFSGMWSATPLVRTDYGEECDCLNPTFSGMWSATSGLSYASRKPSNSLNPTFSGMWSATLCIKQGNFPH